MCPEQLAKAKIIPRAWIFGFFKNCPQKQTKPLSAMYGEIIQGSENKTPSQGVQLISFDFSSILLLH